MRTITLAMAGVLSMPLFIGSCFERNQHQYPEKVVLPSEGGTVTVRGGTTLGLVDLYENGEWVGMKEVIGDTFYTYHDWLTVKTPMNAPEVIFSAKPLEEGSRRMTVISFIGYDELEIEVIQQ